MNIHAERRLLQALSFDLNGKQLIGNTTIDAVSEDVQQPALPVLTPCDTLLDDTNDGTMVSLINKTALGSLLPPSDPILQQCEPITVYAVLMTEEPSQSPSVSDDIHMVSQTQDGIAYQSDNLNLEYISDDYESVTSQADASIAHDINDAFQPKDEDYHAILAHKFNDGILELKVEYSTGDTTYLP